jgi:hypothetical protein
MSVTRAPLLVALRRYSTLVILCVVLGAGTAAGVSFRSDVAYTGSATFLVPVAAGTSTSVTPYDAERIARTYAVVIAEDDRLLTALGHAVNRSSKEVSDRTSTVALPNSAAVRVSYRGVSRSEVRAYFNALTSLVQSASPPSGNITPGTLHLLNVDSDIPQSGGGSWVATLAGAIGGLLIGLGAANFLTRASPRVSGARELREAGGPVVLDVDLADRNSVAALAIRTVDDLPGGGWVAVVGATDTTQDVVEGLARTLTVTTGDLVEEGALDEACTRTRWLAAEFGRGAERVAQDSDRTLLVVHRGDKLTDVAVRMSDLHDLGVTDVILAVVKGTPPHHPAPQHTLAGKPARALTGPEETGEGTVDEDSLVEASLVEDSEDPAPLVGADDTGR